MRVKLPTQAQPSHAPSRYATEESLDEQAFQAQKNEVRRSLALPAGLPSDWPESESHVIVNFKSVQLSSEARHNPSVKRVFVVYEFLPEFCYQEDQVR